MAHPCTRRTALQLLAVLPVAVSRTQPAKANTPQGSASAPVQEKVPPPKAYDMLRMDGERIITEEEHFGIINGLVTVGINHRDVGTLSGLFAPPYASSDFNFELRLYGERVRTRKYDWRPT